MIHYQWVFQEVKIKKDSCVDFIIMIHLNVSITSDTKTWKVKIQPTDFATLLKVYTYILSIFYISFDIDIAFIILTTDTANT
jgi:rRNA processing protein Krr1/Pno1